MRIWNLGVCKWEITELGKSGCVSTIIFKCNRCGLTKAPQLKDPNSAHAIVKYYQSQSGVVNMFIDRAINETNCGRRLHAYILCVALFITDNYPKSHGRSRRTIEKLVDKLQVY